MLARLRGHHHGGGVTVRGIITVAHKADKRPGIPEEKRHHSSLRHTRLRGESRPPPTPPTPPSVENPLSPHHQKRLDEIFQTVSCSRRSAPVPSPKVDGTKKGGKTSTVFRAKKKYAPALRGRAVVEVAVLLQEVQRVVGQCDVGHAERSVGG